MIAEIERLDRERNAERRAAKAERRAAKAERRAAKARGSGKRTLLSRLLRRSE